MHSYGMNDSEEQVVVAIQWDHCETADALFDLSPRTGMEIQPILRASANCVSLCGGFSALLDLCGIQAFLLHKINHELH